MEVIQRETAILSDRRVPPLLGPDLFDFRLALHSFTLVLVLNEHPLLTAACPSRRAPLSAQTASSALRWSHLPLAFSPVLQSFLPPPPFRRPDASWPTTLSF